MHSKGSTRKIEENSNLESINNTHANQLTSLTDSFLNKCYDITSNCDKEHGYPFSCVKIPKHPDLSESSVPEDFFWVFETESECSSLEALRDLIRPVVENIKGSFPEHLEKLIDIPIRLSHHPASSNVIGTFEHNISSRQKRGVRTATESSGVFSSAQRTKSTHTFSEETLGPYESLLKREEDLLLSVDLISAINAMKGSIPVAVFLKLMETQQKKRREEFFENHREKLIESDYSLNLSSSGAQCEEDMTDVHEEKIEIPSGTPRIQAMGRPASPQDLRENCVNILRSLAFQVSDDEYLSSTLHRALLELYPDFFDVRKWNGWPAGTNVNRQENTNEEVSAESNNGYLDDLTVLLKNSHGLSCEKPQSAPEKLPRNQMSQIAADLFRRAALIQAAGSLSCLLSQTSVNNDVKDSTLYSSNYGIMGQKLEKQICDCLLQLSPSSIVYNSSSTHSQHSSSPMSSSELN